MTWVVHTKTGGIPDSYQMNDQAIADNIKVIREADQVNGSYRILLDIEDVVLVWHWAVDNDLIVYLRNPEP